VNVESEVLLNIQCMQHKCYHITRYDWHSTCSEVQLYSCLSSALYGDSS